MVLYGYKGFYKGLVNKYGNSFQLNVLYNVDGTIKFGQNGFHFCRYLEDVFRYFDTFKDEVEVAFVRGSGDVNICNDEYYEFFDMYATEELEIVKVLTRQEIIDYMLKLPAYRVKRFVSLYKLTDDEIILFQNKFSNDKEILLTIQFYQYNKQDAFEEEYKVKKLQK